MENNSLVRTVFIAGATGYLGRHLVAEYKARGWQVRALARSANAAKRAGIKPDEVVVASATDPQQLRGIMEGAELVVSALGITRQRDGLSYWDVDYQANVNLLEEAIAADVKRFAYVHVLNAEAMTGIPLVDAKNAFVERLIRSPIASTVVRPSGFFSDLEAFLDMAISGRIWLLGDGSLRLNPIHGADLAAAMAEAISDGRDDIEIGGPDILSQAAVAELAFSAIGTDVRITRLPDFLRRIAQYLAPRLLPKNVLGPLEFFLAAIGRDMVAEPYGSRRVVDHFSDLLLSRQNGMER